MTGRICGTGSCVPSFAMDNNDIAKLVDTSDEWIRERTGVVRRHIIREETTVSMAAEAGRQALENAGIAAEDVDLIIVSTISSNVILPCTACEVQRELGAKRATCFDLSAACTGFVVAYNTAAAYLNAGVYQTALIIGSESLSNLTNWKDRGTCILFGDGAGAAVLKSEDMRYYLPVTHSDGSKGEALCCRSRYDRSELSPEDLPKPDDIEKIGEHIWKIQGGAILDDVAEVINVELPVEKYDTFSGFVCGVLERVPEDGEQFRCSWKNLDIVVNQVRNHTVVEGIVHVQPEKKVQEQKEEI